MKEENAVNERAIYEHLQYLTNFYTVGKQMGMTLKKQQPEEEQMKEQTVTFSEGVVTIENPAYKRFAIDPGIIEDIEHILDIRRAAGQFGPQYTTEQHVNALLRQAVYGISANG